MLVNMKEMLEEAKRKNSAVGSFNCPNFETVRAVIRAAEEIGCPVILNHGEGHEEVVRLEEIAPVLLGEAKKAQVPVCVHIDHGMSPGFLLRAIRAGFSSIMYDCSMYPLDENIRRVKEFVDYVRPLGITVEAELGSMLNNIPHSSERVRTLETEDIQRTFTDPEAAEIFVTNTGVDALTVSFGSLHGAYKTPPVLDFELLDRISERTGNCALVMHGASGIDDEQLEGAVRHGIRKINYYTAVSTAPTEAIRNAIEDAEDGIVFFHELSNLATEVMKREAGRVMRIFQNASKE